LWCSPGPDGGVFAGTIKKRKRISKLKLPEDCIIIAGLRGNEVIIPRGDTRFREGDTIIMLIRKESKEAFKRIFLKTV
jgi:Trk K+ transport system NAD-binding subunit